MVAESEPEAEPGDTDDSDGDAVLVSNGVGCAAAEADPDGATPLEALKELLGRDAGVVLLVDPALLNGDAVALPTPDWEAFKVPDANAEDADEGAAEGEVLGVTV